MSNVVALPESETSGIKTWIQVVNLINDKMRSLNVPSKFLNGKPKFSSDDILDDNILFTAIYDKHTILIEDIRYRKRFQYFHFDEWTFDQIMKPSISRYDLILLYLEMITRRIKRSVESSIAKRDHAQKMINSGFNALEIIKNNDVDLHKLI